MWCPAGLLLHIPEERIPKSLAEEGTSSIVYSQAAGSKKRQKQERPKRPDATKLNAMQKVAFSLSAIGFDYDDCNSSVAQNRKMRLMTDSLKSLFEWYNIDVTPHHPPPSPSARCQPCWTAARPWTAACRCAVAVTVLYPSLTLPPRRIAGFFSLWIAALTRRSQCLGGCSGTTAPGPTSTSRRR